MEVQKVPFDQIPALSHKDVFYQLHFDQLASFTSFEPSMEGMAKAIEERKKFQVDRKLLVSVLQSQYEPIGTTFPQQQAINALAEENTFTVVTAHQPVLLGGPAYYFYKIFSAIHLARSLQQTFPTAKFVPVFINGSEDHDFEEVRNVWLFGKKVSWESHQSGPVGRFSTGGLAEAIDQAADILGTSAFATQMAEAWRTALNTSTTYNEFVFSWLNKILGEEGLLILSMDDKRLKQAFVPVMEREIVEMPSEQWVKETQDRLAAFHFKPQAYVRDVNLFYMQENSRERISFQDGKYTIQHQKKEYSRSELVELLYAEPENFSPNVVLRPLYQEAILPNLAYIGGGGELAYWLERKTQFAHFDIFFPVLIRRNSALLVASSIRKSMEKLGISTEEIFQPMDRILTSFLERVSQGEFHLDGEKELLEILLEKIGLKAKAIDPTLEAFALGEGQKMLKGLEHIEARLKKALKQKEETNVAQLQNLKLKLFPEEKLQERHDSLFQFWVNQGEDWQKRLIEMMDPLDKEFLVIDL
ncbi:MAG: bacillithiol biosynthesis cysteine-adding enzyme BshC [Saprospiraceae bacterium]|jgi:bacillithiol biosynthesis cysteine-adding enzyme BshC|nr:bacillithiol biosynthesis cysteine-adding enzyme BshC [Saprospiraceae bacterium]